MYAVGASSHFALDARPFVLSACVCVAVRFGFENGGICQYKNTSPLRRIIRSVVFHEQGIRAHLWLGVTYHMIPVIT